MIIRKTNIAEINEVMKIYEKARAFMIETGNPNQWGKNNPPQSKIEADINAGNNYVCEDDGNLIGAFTYFYGVDDPTYQLIEDGKWLNDAPYGVLHSVAVATSGKGVGGFMLDWAMEQSGNIRIDTHADNKPMQRLLQKKGYEYCGIIYTSSGDPRKAYQLTK